jgi:hypothetical protein
MTSVPLHEQRCFHHAAREAVARCPLCRRFFCRECVVEHEDRIVCAACLDRVGRDAAAPVGRWRVLGLAAQGVAAVLIAWLFFYGIGRGLLLLPDDFHRGTLWQTEPGASP